jgi:transposase-like protein
LKSAYGTICRGGVAWLRAVELTRATTHAPATAASVCQEHGISETLYYGWRDKLFEAGLAMLARKEERQGERELRRRCAS